MTTLNRSRSQPEPNLEAQFTGFRGVRALLGFSEKTTRRTIQRDPTFPKPVQLTDDPSATCRFHVPSLRAWAAAKAAEAQVRGARGEPGKLATGKGQRRRGRRVDMAGAKPARRGRMVGDAGSAD